MTKKCSEYCWILHPREMMSYLVWVVFLFPSLLVSDEYILDLGSIGSVRYTYQEGRLLFVERLTVYGDVKYIHSYYYDIQGRLASEELIGDLGKIIYQQETARSPYSYEQLKYVPEENIFYHTLDEMVYSYPLLNNGELAIDKPDIQRDNKGRVEKYQDTSFAYDEYDRLIKVTSGCGIVEYGYSDNGLRISRTFEGETQYYLHLGINEYAILDSKGKLKELRIPGLASHKDVLRPIAIETEDAIYAPIHDMLGNIIKLIDIYTHNIIEFPVLKPFGDGLSKNVPISWIFSGKHFDPVSNLVYFGYRYYAPEWREWLTADPLGQNPYQYCMGNPFTYMDPDGQFALALRFLQLAWGAGITLSSPIWGPAALTTAAVALVTYTGSEIYKNYQKIDASKEKEGKQKDGCPQSNQAQNDQFGDAVKDIERKLGKKLTEKEVRKLHDSISKQDYGYHDIVKEGIELFE